MNNEVVEPIILSTNYSGACAHGLLSNDDLMKLTNPRNYGIHAPTLFALKYRAMPCTLNGNPIFSTNEYDDIYAYNLTGQFTSVRQGQRSGGKERRGGWYHATR